MHPSAEATGKAFFELYHLPRYHNCLDVGALDVNGTLRPYCPVSYTGLDQVAGPNVDLVEAHRPWSIPDKCYDIVVSTSCLEHDPAFWLTFAEMARVLTPGGVIYLSAPSNGDVHRHPVDCWRFYPDAGIALADSVPGINLIESFLARPDGNGWIDFVAVFGKSRIEPPSGYLSDKFK